MVPGATPRHRVRWTWPGMHSSALLLQKKKRIGSQHGVHETKKESKHPPPPKNGNETSTPHFSLPSFASIPSASSSPMLPFRPGLATPPPCSRSFPLFLSCRLSPRTDICGLCKQKARRSLRSRPPPILPIPGERREKSGTQGRKREEWIGDRLT